jgi:integrase/recombinase XerD
MEVQTAVSDYLASTKHLEETTQLGYEQRLNVFAEWCKHEKILLEQVNNRNVQTFLAWLRETRTPKRHDRTQISTHTIAGYIRSIWVFLHWCVQDEEEYSSFVTAARVKGVKMPRQEQFIKGTFTEDEIEALFDACHHPDKEHEYKLRDTAIVSVLLDTGIRAGELRTLPMSGVTISNNVKEDSYIKVMGKGRKQREIPIGNKTRRALGRYMRECRKGMGKAELVFLSRHGDALSHKGLTDVLLRLKDFSPLSPDTDVNPHKFRHTFATRFMANGGDVYDLSRFLGHSSVRVTEDYLKSLSAKAVRTRRQHMSVLDNL